MKFNFWVVAGALLAVPACALAQQAADPADPRATVPAAVYVSVFTNVSRSAPDDNELTPDKVWRAANDAVAGATGHAAHGDGGTSAKVDAHAGHVPAAQAAPAPSSGPVDPPAVDHSKHH